MVCACACLCVFVRVSVHVFCVCLCVLETEVAGQSMVLSYTTLVRYLRARVRVCVTRVCVTRVCVSVCLGECVCVVLYVNVSVCVRAVVLCVIVTQRRSLQRQAARSVFARACVYVCVFALILSD